MAGTPIVIMDTRRVTLRPTQNDDGMVPVDLLFAQLEFDRKTVSKKPLSCIPP